MTFATEDGCEAQKNNVRDPMHIQYEINENVKPEEFRQLLLDSTLAERRPVEDYACLKGMLENSNLIISAWHNQKLVGIARSVTDFHYCCYLSDLAVHQEYQNQGIGLKLQQLTQQRLGPRCKIILLAAPAAKDYYQHIGYEHNERCWVLDREQRLGAD